MNPKASLAPITYSGHMDTVHPHGIFGYPPVRIDEEKVYGPGVIDCKGGVVCGFLAMEALQNCGFTARPIQMLLQSDEECGSKISNKATVRYICEKAKDSLADRMADAESRGIPMPNADESMDDYVARVRESGVNTKDGAIDLLDLLVAAVGALNLKKRDLQDVIDRGHYSWRRPVAVPLNEFADLVENYIGDCLEDGYNLKSSAQVREEKKAADKANRESKKNA
jgi:hypothetical protein